MGAELGATTSIFPSDHRTKQYMEAQSRGKDWAELIADDDAEYDGVIEIVLDDLEPMISRPHSPDSVVPVREVAGTPVTQVLVGSCTNSSFVDLQTVAGALKGKTVDPGLSFGVTPGSRQVFTMIARSGALGDLIESGARILESACGPCIGMGQAPASGAVSVRSFNRNFEGRSGTPNALVYLASPETCAASALTGVITDPRTLGARIEVDIPEKYLIEDNMIVPPAEDPDTVEVLRGPNIKPLPINRPIPANMAGQVLLKVGDNITTDHIMPAGAKILPLRSNIPAISEYVFEKVDPSFATRARQQGGGFVVGGSNYGQGSSREHAALAPMHLGVRGVITKSFARIHRDNLINFGIIPMTFVNVEDYDKISERDELIIENVREDLLDGDEFLTLNNLSKGDKYEIKHGLTMRQINIILAGGLLNYIRQQGDASKIEREATAAAIGSTTAMPTKTTKTTASPGATPRPLSRAEEFDQMVVARAGKAVEEHDRLGHGLHEKTDARFAELLEPKKGDRCLDIATASGTLALALADRVGPDGRVVAIDLAQAMLDLAERKARARRLRNIEWKQMNAQNLEFEDNTFDVVACSLAIFYFPDIEGALQEMMRVLKPGGKLGITTADPETAFSPLSQPYMAALRKLSDELKLDQPEYSDTAKLTRQKKGLLNLVKEAGFKDVEITEESIPVRFTTMEDWWEYGRGSTWGDLLLDRLTPEQKAGFRKTHEDEIKKHFGAEGIRTATTVLLVLAKKPEE